MSAASPDQEQKGERILIQAHEVMDAVNAQSQSHYSQDLLGRVKALREDIWANGRCLDLNEAVEVNEHLLIAIAVCTDNSVLKELRLAQAKIPRHVHANQRKALGGIGLGKS